MSMIRKSMPFRGGTVGLDIETEDVPGNLDAGTFWAAVTPLTSSTKSSHYTLRGLRTGPSPVVKV